MASALRPLHGPSRRLLHQIQPQERDLALLRPQIPRVPEHLADQAAPHQNLAAVLQLQEHGVPKEPAGWAVRVGVMVSDGQEVAECAEVARADGAAQRDEVGC